MVMLSDRQRDMLAYIKAHWHLHGYAPTVREIGRACEISSTSVVAYNLDRLAEQGLIKRSAHKARAISLANRKGAGV